MTILSTIEVSPLSSTSSMSGGNEYRRRFMVFSDRPDESPDLVKAASGIPIIGEAFVAGGVTNFGSFVNTIDARQSSSNRRAWEVEVRYSSENPNEDKTQNPEDQTDPLTYRWGSINIERAQGFTVEDDPDGGVKLSDPIKNSAGEIYDPPPTEEIAIPTLTMTGVSLTFDVTLIPKFVNKLNSAALNVGNKLWAERTVKCASLEANWVYNNGESYWDLTQELHFYEEVTIPTDAGNRVASGWDDHLLDHGTYYIDGSGNKIKFTDSEGNPIKGNLDGSGGKLADGEPPVYITFKRKGSSDFATLPVSLASVPN